VESAGTKYGLILLGITVAPSNPEKLTDTIAAAQSPFPDLRLRQGEPAQAQGIVKTRDGKAIARAIVRVSAIREFNTDDKTAVQTGPGVGLGTETDENGRFILPPLPDNKLYRLVVWSPGYESYRYRGMDAKSDPIEIHLKPQKDSSPNPKFAIHGRVIGPDRKPIPFALVEHDGIGYDGGTSWGGNAEGLPGDVISDAKGEFIFGRDKGFNRLQISIKIPDLAPVHRWFEVTNSVQDVTMGVGATLRGRVVKDGQPLTNLAVQACGSDRNSEVFAGVFDAKTGTNGEFLFEHLPPNISWDVYGKLSSFKEYGALPPRIVISAGDGESTDLGDLQVVPAIHLAGQVKTRNGEPLPKGLKVSAGYNEEWDGESAAVDDKGHFLLEGLSPRQVDISIQERNWLLTVANRSLDTWNPWSLTGLLEGNKDDLLLVIDKGEPNYNGNYSSANGQLPPADQSRSRPLWGAEDSGPPYIVLAGSVVDDTTGQPIKNFKIIPGHKPPVSAMPMAQAPKSLLKKVLDPFAGSKPVVPWNERIYWQYSSTETMSNGAFSVPFIPLTSTPVLRVEASGYQPLETDPTNQTTTNLVLRLKKGAGPNGVVLLPNGSLATRATVVYAVNQEQFSLEGRSLSNYGQRGSQKVTGVDGKFSFERRAEESMIFVSHPTGWGQQSLDRGRENLTIELKPWASISGTLVNSNNAPMPGVKLAVTMFHNWNQGGAYLNLQEQTVTDAQGHFLFTNVPPARVEVQRVIPFAGGGWSYQEQSWLFVQPGITNDLGKVTYDHPPPAPAMERFKQQLGL
ncbi:MAG TPA: carboxypeptidase-like regulatory domain-containing protein, partial [Verrucomicrobiae bacterium]|nr:carboxypeptidase-like regulatory domain-containing protein [Verrucomicrobiae bacterium]